MSTRVPHTLGKLGALSVADTGIQDEDRLLPLASHWHVTLKASRYCVHNTQLQHLHYIYFSYLSWL